MSYTPRRTTNALLSSDTGERGLSSSTSLLSVGPRGEATGLQEQALPSSPSWTNFGASQLHLPLLLAFSTSPFLAEMHSDSPPASPATPPRPRRQTVSCSTPPPNLQASPRSKLQRETQVGVVWSAEGEGQEVSFHAELYQVQADVRLLDTTSVYQQTLARCD
jgi:hypothetical protein